MVPYRKMLAIGGDDTEAAESGWLQQQSTWRDFATMRVGETIKLIEDSGSSEASLQAAISVTGNANVLGDDSGNVLVLFNSALAQESATYPHLRMPPFRKPQAVRLINAVISHRRSLKPLNLGAKDADKVDKCKIIPGDLLCFLDSGKKKNADLVSKLLVSSKGRWSVIARQEGLVGTVTHVQVSERSLKERRQKVRGVCSLNQLQGMNRFRNVSTVIPEVPHKKYEGSNLGNVIGPVPLEKWADSWKLPVEEKRELYGEWRRAVGGRTQGAEPKNSDDDSDDIDDDVDGEQPTIPSWQMPRAGKLVDYEPVFWWAFPSEFYEEIISGGFAKHIIDTTPGPGHAAIACLEHEPPLSYLGICMATTDHKLKLKEHLVDHYLSLMKKEGHAFYTPAYAKLFSTGEPGTPAQAKGAGADKVKKRKAVGKAASKK